jgi:hypothetical protein
MERVGRGANRTCIHGRFKPRGIESADVLAHSKKSAVVPANSKRAVLVRGLCLECGNPAAAGPLLKTATDSEEERVQSLIAA